MIFTETPLGGSFVIDLEPITDDRGFFARSFCAHEMTEHGLESVFVQTNISGNRHRGILRGMHYQRAPHEETKLVRCIRGSVFDVIVDLREDSATRGRWFGTKLSAALHNMLYVPVGFAHGYQVLEDDTELFYMMSTFYKPGAEGGLRWNDPSIDIQWPITDNVQLSERDAELPLFV